MVVFNYLSRTVLATLKGHRSAVTSLAYNTNGSQLISGGADCDIVLWDTVTYASVFRLHDHKDAVTHVTFLTHADVTYIVSVSKDTLVKVWDLTTGHCIQTLVGHRCEIWCLAVVNIPTASGPVTGVVTGADDEILRIYHVATSASAIDNDVLLPKGEITLRGGEKCTSLAVDGNIVAAVSGGGKHIEVSIISAMHVTCYRYLKFAMRRNSRKNLNASKRDCAKRGRMSLE